MQIVSHMDSRDKHRVRGYCVLWGGLRVGLVLYTPHAGWGPHNQMDMGLAWCLLQGVSKQQYRVIHTGRGPVFPGAWRGGVLGDLDLSSCSHPTIAFSLFWP